LPLPEESAKHTQRIYTPKYKDLQPDARGKFPSLRNFMLHFVRATSPPGTLSLVRGDFTSSGFPAPDSIMKELRENYPFCSSTPDSDVLPDTYPTSLRKISQRSDDRLLALSPAALVVVPDQLVDQWTLDIMKHCDDDIKYLVVDQHTKLDSVLNLARDYDVSHNRL
jgi:hypothetical protein